MAKKTLGDVLIKLEVLSKKQVTDALKAAEKENQQLDAYLLEQGLATEKDIAQAYAQLLGFDFLARIDENMVAPESLEALPLKFLRHHTIIPLFMDGKHSIAVADPYDFQAIDELRLQFGEDAPLLIAPRSVIHKAINKFYPLEGTKEVIKELEQEEAEPVDFEAIVEEDILGMAQEAPIIKLVNHIFYQAVQQDASDIHIEPFEKEVRVRYRIDGVLYPVLTPPKRTQSALISRIKIMANLNIAEKRKPQDGRIQIKIADKPIDIRVSVLPVAHGERVVMRLLDKSKTFVSLDKLGMSSRDMHVLENSIEQPNGIILITGPTGSGKTSTLYSILNQLNNPEVNIITVEDPVEYQLAGIGQVQVKEKVGLTFAAALRSILRQDPDIIMIGETRDQETAQIAIQSALTGHLVLSTLHTNSAAATITRLIDMGIEPFLIASTVTTVVAQRLVRRLCDKCKKAYKPDKDILKRLGISAQKGAKLTFYKAVGCPACLETGYKGRLALFEVMVMSNALARMTIDQDDTSALQNQAEKEGMTLLLEDGIKKAEAGLTTIEEVLAVASTQEQITQ